MTRLLLILGLILLAPTVRGEFLCATTSTDQDTVMRTKQAGSVEVKSKRLRYKKKNNPAHDLASILVQNKHKHDPRSAKNLIYTRHEKIVVSLDDFKEIDSTKAFSSLNSGIVINQFSGRRMLPISLKERVLETTSRGGAIKEKELLKQSFGIDEKLDQNSIMAYLKTALESTDIFKDNISFVQRRFVSPVSRSGLDFYRYYLDPDTTTVDGARCVRLSFFPSNKEGLGFTGSLYVQADSTHLIHRARITIPRTADLNYINNLSINIQYTYDELGFRYMKSELMNFDFSITKNTTALNAQRENIYSDYNILSDNINVHPIRAKVESRITDKEQRVVQDMSKVMRTNFLYALSEQLVIIASTGYIGSSSNSRFDIGPVFNFVSGNQLEGTRLTFGGMTTPKLFKRLFFEGYAGYGTRDQRWKYSAAAEWSFVARQDHMREFPVHSLRASYTDDIRKFGAPFGQNSTDNVFSWLTRTPDSSLTYIRNAELTYVREHASHLSYFVTARHYKESSSSVMTFAPGVDSYRMSELQIGGRYAPGEIIFQTKRRRYNMDLFAPVFEFNHTIAFKGVLGSSYSTNRTEVGFSHRFNLRTLGYLDLKIKGGVQWNKVPYMLLPHPPVNPSYVLREGRFALMQPLEYLYDRYLSWDVSYYLNGLIVNHVPLINKLKWREVITCRGLWGALSPKNDPLRNAMQTPFPTHSAAMGREPYIEMGVGLENILNIFRVDYCWRLTYLDKQSTVHSGILLSARFKF